MSDVVIVKYVPVLNQDGSESSDRIASLCINRPGTANAFSGEILVSISKNLEEIAQDKSVRALLFQSIGKHFSAGADLNWMKDSAKLGFDHNFAEAKKLTAMFEQLCNMPMPTIAVAKGAAYGGAVGIIACCDYALATDDAKMCLSEARVGLIPAVILPYLSRKVRTGDLRRLTLTAKVFSANEAIMNGLVQIVEDRKSMNELLINELNQLLTASPHSQLAYKNLQVAITSQNNAQTDTTAKAIADIRASEMGQEGLTSFFEKRKPVWSKYLPEDAVLFEDF